MLRLQRMDARFSKWLRKLPRRYKKYRQPAGLWSMTIARELAFCESYARECFSGAGRIVDLGCWFGATTFSLARGLTKNRRAKNNRRIDAFDLFIWNKWMQLAADPIGMPVKYREGESFLRRSAGADRALQGNRPVTSGGSDATSAGQPARGISLHRRIQNVVTGRKDCSRFFPAADSGCFGRCAAGFHFSSTGRRDESSLDVAIARSFRVAASNPAFGQCGFLVQKKNRSRRLCRRWNRNRFRSKKSIRPTNTAGPASSRTTDEHTSRRRSYCS